MKTIKLFIFLLLSTLSTQLTAETNYLPDTLWYDNGNEIYVRFSLHDMTDIGTIANDSAIISPIVLNAINKDDLKALESLLITVDETNNDGILTVDKETESFIILPEELNANSGSSFKSLKLKRANGSVIDFYFTDLDGLISFIQNDWNIKIPELAREADPDMLIKDHMMRKRRMMTIYGRNFDSKIIVDEPSISNISGNLDQITLTAGVGVSTFKKEFLPEFNFRMALQFSKKGILKNSYFAEYDLMYDFPEVDGKTVPKSGNFLSLGYMRNFSDNPDEADWYGLSIGYLLKKSSPIFDDDTWKVSIYRKIGKNKEVAGHLFFPDNFGSVFPGISLGIDL